jgi:hypothetical protein
MWETVKGILQSIGQWLHANQGTIAAVGFFTFVGIFALTLLILSIREGRMKKREDAEKKEAENSKLQIVVFEEIAGETMKDKTETT